MPNADAPLRSAIVVISDLVEWNSALPGANEPEFVDHGPSPAVMGGYLERLPLAAVRHGLCERAEIWHHHRGDETRVVHDGGLTRRAFPINHDQPPFHSQAMIDFIKQFGAPAILCVWGLGVSEPLLDACRDSVIIYNSIDVPALRVPSDISRHFHLVLTGSQEQSDDVAARHKRLDTAILPIGPEFASPETFFPMAGDKPYDCVYVAAAQAYKRHDILFDALANSLTPLRALCVMGYGEDGERLRHEARERRLDMDFVGPPGVSHAEVNRLINTARVGLVCGENDGAPAILTEYMLAGLPVVANAALRCGLQYIRPDTGIAAPAAGFAAAIVAARDGTQFRPRQAVLDNWAWPHSIGKLAELIEDVQEKILMNQRIMA